MSNPSEKSAAPTSSVMEQIVALAKRRGFVYPASEIYGGIRGFWDYGPLGVLLKNNIRDHWWNWMVECPPIGPDGEIVEMVGLDSAIIQHQTTWVASGHAATFADPLVEDTKAKQQIRADHFFGVTLLDDGPNFSADFEAFEKCYIEKRPYPIAFTVIASGIGEAYETLAEEPKLIKQVAKFEEGLPYPDPELHYSMRKGGARKIGFIRLVPQFMLQEHTQDIPSPFTLEKGNLTKPRPFNLMLDTFVGSSREAENKAYLRPETAQGIFLNFKNVVDTTRVKVPFGVAQVGKSFRNELTPRNFIFRSREFEQMEMEFFCPPDDALKWYDFWKHNRMAWWESLGVAKENLRFRDHDQDELSHYSKATVDIEYKYPFTAPDFGELEGVAHRGDYDLTQHQKHSGQKLDYFDQELQLRLKAEGVADDEVKRRSRYLPNVIEPASGLTRAVLVLLCEAYTPDPSRPSGVYMKFKPQFAPIKLGIFPLVNKEGMPEIAKKLYMSLRSKFTCEYDAKQSIGKRYARMDEIGTPFCVTIDGDTLKDGTVTVRDRDTQQQEKMHIDLVEAFLREKMA